jgi:hypothetical protein
MTSSESNLTVAPTEPKRIPLGPQQGYVEMLDEAILQHEVDEAAKGRTRNPLRPSSAGECARKLAYQYREFKGIDPNTVEDREANIVRLLDIGHYIERHIIQQFRKVKGADAKYLQQVLSFFEVDDTWIEGSMDLGISSGEHKGSADAKSKGDKFSSYHKTKWDEDAETYANMRSVQAINEKLFYIDDLDAFLKELQDDYFKANFYQLNMYCCSDFLKSRGFDHGSILQYNKNDSRMREFRFRPSETVYKYVEDKFKRVHDLHLTPDEVERERKLGTSNCAFCVYKERCRPNLDAKEAYFATFPDKQWPRDTNRLGDAGAQLEQLYEVYKETASLIPVREQAEESIVHLMEQRKVKKVRFSDGAIFEIKFLKSPRPHFELRRAKL